MRDHCTPFLLVIKCQISVSSNLFFCHLCSFLFAHVPFPIFCCASPHPPIRYDSNASASDSSDDGDDSEDDSAKKKKKAKKAKVVKEKKERKPRKEVRAAEKT